jgi:hypothetical protein
VRIDDADAPMMVNAFLGRYMQAHPEIAATPRSEERP